MLDDEGHVYGTVRRGGLAYDEVGREVGDERGGIGPARDVGERLVNGFEEAQTQTGMPVLIPSSGFA